MMDTLETTDIARQREVASAGVSWGAIVAGAFVAAAISLILLALGAGLELSAVSPWSTVGAATLGAAAIIWLIFTQAAGSAMGGYLAGRLRTRWQAIHNDEVHFRDTANGLITWAVGVVITFSFLTTAATALTGGPLGPARTNLQATATLGERTLRTPVPNPAYANGLEPMDQRISDDMARYRAEQEKARKDTAHLLLWTFIALMVGAFCASYAATIGGRQRDHVRAI